MYIVVFPQFLWRYAIPYWCELIFILEITGIPEPADRECQEAHTLYNAIKKKCRNIISVVYLYRTKILTIE